MKNHFTPLFLGAALLLAANSCSSKKPLPVVPPTPEERASLADAEKLRQEGKWSDAAAILEDLDETVTDPDTHARILLLWADCARKDKDLKSAFYALRDVLDKHPAQVDYEKTAALQLEIADEYYGQYKEETEWFSAKPRSIEFYQEYARQSPYGKLTPSRLRRVGDMQREREDYADAVQTWTRIIKRYRETEEAGFARMYLMQYYLGEYKRPWGDLDLLVQARNQLSFFQQQFRKHPLLEEAKVKMKEIHNLEAERLYVLAEFYLKEGQWCDSVHYRPEAASRYLYLLLLKYEDTEWALKAEKLLAQLDPKFKPTLEQKRKEFAARQGQLDEADLPPDLSDRTLRRILMTPEESKGKFLLPVEDLDLRPTEKDDSHAPKP
ncbi:MAG: hypothetical protein RL095_1945 [Verrucomicrobiota bacterium]|jgi:outer membrane protein assembly factor BamD (BamD/ComL family)